MGKKKYTLQDCFEMHRLHPDTFDIPDDRTVAMVARGLFVKLIFMAPGYTAERMWVKVGKYDHKTHKGSGTLSNQPACGLQELIKFGAKVSFERKHMADVMCPAMVARWKNKHGKG